MNEVESHDGMLVSGYYATDSMCIGHYGTYEQFTDAHTTVCMKQQKFFLVTEATKWDWSMRATDTKHIDSVCGLGKERPSEHAEGWLARAVYEGRLKEDIYSLQLVPQ